MPERSKNTNPITLGIEMSNPSSTIAGDPAHAIALWQGTLTDAKPIASAPMPEGTRGSDGVMIAIESLCAANDIKPVDITRILVSCGPGGYTALRIATTTAKMLAHTLNAALVAVPSARVGAVAITSDDRPALITLASKKNMAHASMLLDTGQVEEIGIISAERLTDLDMRSIVADSHMPESFAMAAQLMGVQCLKLRLDARNLLQASAGLEPVDPLHLAPIYAREPGAVTQWRARGSQ